MKTVSENEKNEEIKLNDEENLLKEDLKAFNKESYLRKKANKKLVGYHRRYVVLNNLTFGWYKNNKSSQPQKIFSLRKIDDCITHKKLKFIIVKQFFFKILKI